MNNLLKKITCGLSNQILIIFSVFGMLYNASVLLNIIPREYAWGNRVEESQIAFFLIISVVINFLFLLLNLAHGKFISFNKIGCKSQWISICFFIFSIIFFFNTIGNLLALNNLEKYIFSPLTFMLSLCCLDCALNNQ
eukprot:gene12451-gene5946